MASLVELGVLETKHCIVTSHARAKGTVAASPGCSRKTKVSMAADQKTCGKTLRQQPLQFHFLSSDIISVIQTLLSQNLQYSPNFINNPKRFWGSILASDE